MKMFNWLKRKSVSTMSSASLLEFFRLGGSARWFGHSYWNFATEGYAKNIIAYYCITQVSKACADIPIKVSVNGNIVENHEILKLLKRPNPIQGWKTFLRESITHRLISGNSYMHGNVVYSGKIMELTNMRPDRVTIMTSAYCEPYEYQYNYYGQLFVYPIEPITLHSEVLHIKEPNPLSDLYGMSPISAAAMSVDQHNESGEWNKKLLENSARPPGILTVRDKTETALSMDKEQLALLREEMQDKIAGSRNAGKIPILNFDMQWQSLGMSPTDMDWINGKDTSARDICYAFGVPPHMLGLPDNATYNNMGEAKLAFYEETVIPLLQNYLEELSYFINYHQIESGEARKRSFQEIEIVADLTKVSALTIRRETARATARADLAAGLVTLNEARAESNFPPVDGGDEIMVPVGRLPLGFDAATGSMDKSTYTLWLVKNGFDQKFAREMADIAYESH
jgi:HK97 family phage portal protein